MEHNIFPEINLGIVDGIKETAHKVGKFLLGTQNPEVAYPSEHRHIPEPTDGEAMGGYAEVADQLLIPFDTVEATKAAAVKHYVQMAKEARGE